MPESDLDLLIRAAAEGAKIALSYWQTDQRVDRKDGGSPVSEGDFAVDKYLRETLLAARPDYGWLSEETEDDPARLNATRAFIVDPIDGTRAYVAGEKTWALSLAVVENGNPVAAVVYLPVRDKLYTAALGQGAYLADARLTTGTRDAPDGATALVNKPALNPKWWRNAPPDLERNYRPSLAYRFCLVAEGRFDVLLTIKDAHEWDIAAGALIATEAGASVTDRMGKPLVFNRANPKAAGVFVANPVLHRKLIKSYGGGA